MAVSRAGSHLGLFLLRDVLLHDHGMPRCGKPQQHIRGSPDSKKSGLFPELGRDGLFWSYHGYYETRTRARKLYGQAVLGCIQVLDPDLNQKKRAGESPALAVVDLVSEEGGH